MWISLCWTHYPSQDGGEPERMKLVEEIKALNEAARKAEEEKTAVEVERCVFSRIAYLCVLRSRKGVHVH